MKEKETEGIELKDLTYKLITLLFITTNMYALDIIENKEFAKEVKPDTYSMSYSINYRDQNLQEIHATRYFNALLKKIKKRDISCVGGSYYVYPKYNRDNKIQGFSGDITFQCQDTDLTKINRSIEVLKVASQHINAKVRQNPMRVSVSETKANEVRESLKKEAILYTKEYEESLGKVTGKQCITQKINFTEASTIRPMMMERKAFDSVEAPIVNDQKISIKVKYQVQCQ